MPRIFDNIELQLLPSLKKRWHCRTMQISALAILCGWQ